MTIAAAEVPLFEQLRRIPRDAIHQWENPSKNPWDLATCSAPVGMMAHLAADALERATADQSTAQLRRFLALEDILIGFSDGIDGARLQAGLMWAKSGNANWHRKDLISLFASPWRAAEEEAEWKGDAIAEGEKDLDEVTAAALADDPVDAFLDDVRVELIRARAKFPGDRIMTLAMSEEAGELVKAVLDEPAANVRKEAIQTATMAARIVLDGDGSVNEWRAAKGLDPLTSGGAA